jgi:hypothetical protein
MYVLPLGVPLMVAVIRVAIAAILCLVASGILAPAEPAVVEIRVKLLNAHSGKPYVGRNAQLFGTNSRSGLLRANDTSFHLQTRTESDGVAHFQISAPLPYRVLFYSAQANGCGPSGSGSFVTDEVLRSGIVVTNTCAGKHQKFRWQNVKAEPGEIVIFAIEPRGP